LANLLKPILSLFVVLSWGDLINNQKIKSRFAIVVPSDEWTI
jgi:hypothetical protein